ncbi:hypothetical protein [Endozoicomonas arenosclerae]|uniref:hypothetical protein n=1 Tax=Endozoicomonas arenosclerae TaxID=1633495 RepID=UPI0007854FEA|nr:hypothetical protein [Endozoicomonas arenosclerae]
MNTLTIEGWLKSTSETKPLPIEHIHFRVNESYRLLLEQAEEQLQETQSGELFIPVDMDTMELETSDDCGPIRDCQFRVYLRPADQRGLFHLVANRDSDNSLVYSNSVMVDLLG